ncbi:MAG: hypothetical protein MZW92_53990 [Comamonadaceae bacterium]|nr:hypothetical protein [Comamonadaceae bacterium]
MSQAFLLWQQWWQEAAFGVHGVAAHDEQVTAFVMRQAIDTLSPSNFVATNPELLQATPGSGGRNPCRAPRTGGRDAMAALTHGAPKDAEQRSRPASRWHSRPVVWCFATR